MFSLARCRAFVPATNVLFALLNRLHRALNGLRFTRDFFFCSGSDLNAVDNYGDTALKKAAFSGCADVIKLLLASGANPDICDGFMKSPL